MRHKNWQVLLWVTQWVEKWLCKEQKLTLILFIKYQNILHMCIIRRTYTMVQMVRNHFEWLEYKTIQLLELNNIYVDYKLKDTSLNSIFRSQPTLGKNFSINIIHPCLFIITKYL